MQACPYDALYIDPSTNTAAKCNFCTHRLEIGLQPSCVVVCPEQAIIAGDMDDPTTEISVLLNRHPVQVRKPEKETRPKLFYIEADEASLVPTRAAADGRGMWSRGAFVSTDGETADHSCRLPLATRHGVGPAAACMTCGPGRRSGAGKWLPTPGPSRSPPGRFWPLSRRGFLADRRLRTPSRRSWASWRWCFSPSRRRCLSAT